MPAMDLVPETITRSCNAISQNYLCMIHQHLRHTWTRIHALGAMCEEGIALCAHSRHQFSAMLSDSYEKRATGDHYR